MSERPTPLCPHCGGGRIIAGKALQQTAEVGAIGLDYKTAWILRGTEPLFADLCADCGTVTRLYVKNLDRNWS
ncbi:MAG: hypothetical protein QM811_13200 [Pirellulales bacterium]